MRLALTAADLAAYAGVTETAVETVVEPLCERRSLRVVAPPVDHPAARAR
jgi:hypothetical protein